MSWTRSFTTHTTSSAEAVWKRHTTPADWVTDDPMTDAAVFTVPPRTGDEGTVTSRGMTRRFLFSDVRPHQAMTQIMKLPGGRLLLGHEMIQTEFGLQVTHTVSLEGPLRQLLTPLVGWPLVRSRPGVVLALVGHALAEQQQTMRQASS